MRNYFVFLLLITLCTTGCKRAFYRNQADRDAYNLINEKAYDVDLPYDYSIDGDPRSRFFDPFDPDRPPLPPDDADAHALMHCIDGMQGSKKWHCDGDTPFTENPEWAAMLPIDDEGKLAIDRDSAVKLGLLHSINYQRELEDLYLSALDVSFERFRFDTQFSLTNNTFFTADGRLRNGDGNSQSTLQSDTSLRANRLFATGGELVVGFANSMIWTFSGGDSNASTSLVDFNLVQPLLRGAGRAKVLERLTISERTLLGNVRQMERYRRGFYHQVVTGRDAGAGPSRRGGVLGSGLTGFTGVGSGGFGQLGAGGNQAGGGGGFAGGAGAAQAGGYLGLLQQQLQIRNQEANVAALRDSAQQLEAAYDAGRIDRFQADLAQQALYNARSRLLTSVAQYDSTLDNFKVSLGLPPKLELQITDQLLSPFELIDPAIPPLQNTLSLLQENAGQRIEELLPAADAEGAAVDWRGGVRTLREIVSRSREVHRRAVAHISSVRHDLNRLDAALPARRKALERLAAEQRSEDGETPSALQQADLETIREYRATLATLPAKLRRDLGTLAKSFEAFPDKLDALDEELAWLEANAARDPAAARPRLRRALGAIPDELGELSGTVLELSLIQARAKAESVTLTPVDLKADDAFEIARCQRQDWANARTALVDSWRLISFNANELESQLNLVFSGDVANKGDNPLNLNSATGRLRVGVQFEAPLNRMAQRNTYRQALIEYQQAKRNYYTFVDRVSQSLRNTLRTIDLDQFNFELRRAAIAVAVDQVELARLRLQAPPKPGDTAPPNPTLARDLVSALSDLLQVQNDFLSVWVNHEVERLQLDFDLGTMQLDECGLWIDPGSPGQGYGPCDEYLYEVCDESGLDPRCWRPVPEIVPVLPPMPPQRAAGAGEDGRRDAKARTSQPGEESAVESPSAPPRRDPQLEGGAGAREKRNGAPPREPVDESGEAEPPTPQPRINGGGSSPEELPAPALAPPEVQLRPAVKLNTVTDSAVEPASWQVPANTRIAAKQPSRATENWKAAKPPRRDP